MLKEKEPYQPTPEEIKKAQEMAIEQELEKDNKIRKEFVEKYISLSEIEKKEVRGFLTEAFFEMAFRDLAIKYDLENNPKGRDEMRRQWRKQGDKVDKLYEVTKHLLPKGAAMADLVPFILSNLSNQAGERNLLDNVDSIVEK